MSNKRSSSAQSDLHFRMLSILQQHPEYSQREIAKALSIGLGGVNYCMRALAEKGLIKIENFKSSSHKLGYFHVLTPKGVATRVALTSQFLKRKRAEYEKLEVEIEALQASLGRCSAEETLLTRDGARKLSGVRSRGSL